MLIRPVICDFFSISQFCSLFSAFGHLAKSAFARARPDPDKPSLIEQKEWLP